jgi:hypothetical protein
MDFFQSHPERAEAVAILTFHFPRRSIAGKRLAGLQGCWSYFMSVWCLHAFMSVIDFFQLANCAQAEHYLTFFIFPNVQLH